MQFAIATDRCVLTVDRKDFIRLHRARPAHPGIIVGTENWDYPAFAATELYDEQNDPAETVNLAAQPEHRALLKSFAKHLPPGPNSPP